jgi:molybdate transport system substrate-binding protein
MRLQALMTTTIVLLTLQAACAQTTPLRVLASNGMKAVIEELRARLELQLKRPLAIQFNTSAATRQRIESGDAFDVAILTTEVVNELANGGRIALGSVVDLGRSGIGFGVRSTAAKPDVRTPEAVQQTLLKAKSLTWVSVGASRVHIDRMLESLGIAANVKSKTVLTQGVDESVASVAAGNTEIIVTLISEILPAKGIQFVGPLPAKFQNYVSFAGGISPNSSSQAAATQMIGLLAEPAAARTYEAKGMELPIVTDIRPRPAIK